MSILSKTRDFINRHSIIRKWFVCISAKYTVRLYSLQKYLSREGLKNHHRASRWRNLVTSLNTPALEKVVIAGGTSVFHFRDGCIFNVLSLKTSVSSVLFASGSYEENETSLISRLVKPGWIAVDAGANFGWHAIHLSKLVGPSGRVIAFEPVPQTYQELAANTLLNNCQNLTTCNAALGNRENSVTLFVPGIHYGLGAASEFLDCGEKIQVSMLRLDDYVERNSISEINFIKADVEGGELNLLFGARRLLARAHPLILVEVVDVHCKRFGLEPKQLFQFLFGLGYKGLFIDVRGIPSDFDICRPPNGNFLFFAHTATLDLVHWPGESDKGRCDPGRNHDV